ncbi:MAG: hypothetical protein ACKO8I_11230 [Cyanobacteriota bacterium]
MELPLRSRLVRMGLLAVAASEDASGVQLLEALAQAGLCREIWQRWQELSGEDQAVRSDLLEQAYQALEDIPTPASEWAGLREICGDALLERLLAISPASLRRYAAGGRQCPDGVAVRLHWLALVVEALEGTYNPIGIRRWFERPRQLLEGAAPLELLQGPWLPEHPGPQRVRPLAEAARGGTVAS